jgi:anti-anti-sigma factor
MSIAGIGIPLSVGFEEAGFETEDVLGRRIEDWIVSTLDEREQAQIDSDWLASLGKLVPARRPGRAGVAGSSPAPGGWARFRLVSRRGISVVALTDGALVKQEDLRELSDDLLALIEAGHRRIVLDLSAVERLSSWAAGVLADVIARCKDVDGGVVKLCGLRPEVASIFAVTGLDPLVEVCVDATSAVIGIWPVPPGIRPLPVSVLAALTRADEARAAAISSEDDPAMQGARLIALTGRSKGTGVDVDGSTFVIGRSKNCQLRLGSANVSRRHATIERRGKRYFVRDLGSTNGTLLNDRTLHDEDAEIRDGDRLRFGPLIFTLVMIPVDAPARSNARPHLDRTARTSSESPTIDTDDFPTTWGTVDDLVLKHEVIEDVMVVTPLEPELDDEESIGALRDGLVALHMRHLPRRVVINLTHVGHLSGRAIGVLVAHHLRLDRAGGALRICLANPRVSAMLEQVKIGMLVECHPTVDDAVLAAWPEVCQPSPAPLSY